MITGTRRRHGLDHRQAEALVEGGIEEGGGPLVDRRQRLLGDVAEEHDAVADAELLGALADLELEAAAVADAHQLVGKVVQLDAPGRRP